MLRHYNPTGCEGYKKLIHILQISTKGPSRNTAELETMRNLQALTTSAA